MLPVPLRRDVVADEAPDEAETPPRLLPMPTSYGPKPGGPGSRRTPPAIRSGRQLPARLQALDDQTVMPRDVYDKMLKLGDAARGRLGYGQHQLTFEGAEGVPVLRMAA